ncbi:MAG: hypothetical protein Tsb005_20610 [Gammaproteobacteria bacterium]
MLKKSSTNAIKDIQEKKYYEVRLAELQNQTDTFLNDLAKYNQKLIRFQQNFFDEYSDATSYFLHIEDLLNEIKKIVKLAQQTNDEIINFKDNNDRLSYQWLTKFDKYGFKLEELNAIAENFGNFLSYLATGDNAKIIHKNFTNTIDAFHNYVFGLEFHYKIKASTIDKQAITTTNNTQPDVENNIAINTAEAENEIVPLITTQNGSLAETDTGTHQLTTVVEKLLYNQADIIEDNIKPYLSVKDIASAMQVNKSWRTLWLAHENINYTEYTVPYVPNQISFFSNLFSCFGYQSFENEEDITEEQAQIVFQQKYNPNKNTALTHHDYFLSSDITFKEDQAVRSTAIKRGVALAAIPTSIGAAMCCFLSPTAGGMVMISSPTSVCLGGGSLYQLANHNKKSEIAKQLEYKADKINHTVQISQDAFKKYAIQYGKYVERISSSSQTPNQQPKVEKIINDNYYIQIGGRNFYFFRQKNYRTPSELPKLNVDQLKNNDHVQQLSKKIPFMSEAEVAKTLELAARHPTP